MAPDHGSGNWDPGEEDPGRGLRDLEAVDSAVVAVAGYGRGLEGRGHGLEVSEHDVAGLDGDLEGSGHDFEENAAHDHGLNRGGKMG